jgi:hypothetical protein
MENERPLAVVGQIVLSNLGMHSLAQFGVFGRFREAIAIVQLREHIKRRKADGVSSWSGTTGHQQK